MHTTQNLAELVVTLARATEAGCGTAFSAVPSSPIHGQYFPHYCLILPHSWSSVISWGSEALTFLRIPQFQRPPGLFLPLRFSMLIAPSFLSHTHPFSYCMYILKAFSISTLHLAAVLQREPWGGSPSPRGSLGSPSLLSKTFISAACLQRTQDISKDLSNLWHKLFYFLLSGKKVKKRMKTETTKFLNSSCWLVTDQLSHFPSYSKFTEYLISTWSCNCSSPDSSAPFHLCGHLPPGSYVLIIFFHFLLFRPSSCPLYFLWQSNVLHYIVSCSVGGRVSGAVRWERLSACELNQCLCCASTFALLISQN